MSLPPLWYWPAGDNTVDPRPVPVSPFPVTFGVSIKFYPDGIKKYDRFHNGLLDALKADPAEVDLMRAPLVVVPEDT